MADKLIIADHIPIITGFIQTVADIQHHHWNTNSYAEHMALNDAYDSLNSLKDSVVERLTGYYGRFKRIKIDTIPSCALQELPNCISEIGTSLKALGIKDKHTDLDNNGDEILELAGRLKYLLTLT